jgi:hypothetical protein
MMGLFYLRGIFTDWSRKFFNHYLYGGTHAELLAQVKPIRLMSGKPSLPVSEIYMLHQTDYAQRN